ncbi:MAG: EXLDI protein [bacterium]
MPNKTIYVSDGDLPIYERAQEIAGGNLSGAIATALKRFIEADDARREGFDEITVRIGSGAGRKVRFSGILLGEWSNSDWSRFETYRVYRGRTGKYVVHVERTPSFETLNAEGKPAGWLSQLTGLGNVNFRSTPGESTLEVVATLDELKDKIPPQLFEVVARGAKQPPVEDLDI